MDKKELELVLTFSKKLFIKVKNLNRRDKRSISFNNERTKTLCRLSV